MQTSPAPRAASAPPAGLEPLDLAGSLCARLCHDLAGSLGALHGTLELAAEEGDREALGLAVALAQEFSAKLRLLRAAWGAGSEVPPLHSLLHGLPGADRLKTDLAGLLATKPEMQRLALNLLLVAAAALPRGGKITLAGSDQRLTLEIEGLRAAWPGTLINSLADDSALLDACTGPRDLPIALACLQARALGCAIEIESATRLQVSVVGRRSSESR
jgi:histidine phosphotransferase ChpT